MRSTESTTSLWRLCRCTGTELPIAKHFKYRKVIVYVVSYEELAIFSYIFSPLVL